MMKFRTIKDAIIDLLGASAAGQYQVAGYQKQVKSSDEVIDNDRLIQVYYGRGDFPKSGGSMHGPNDHNMTFRIDFTLSKAAEVDLSVIENPASTTPQLKAAILAAALAGKLADDSMDELFDIIYQIIMDAENIDLGLDVGIVSNRWLGDFQKDEPLQRGELVTLTATAQLTCKASEDITGETPITGNAIDTTLNIEDDLGDNAGVLTDPTD